MSGWTKVLFLIGCATAYKATPLSFLAPGEDWGNHDIIYWEYRDAFNPIQGDPSASDCCAKYNFFSWLT